jgi:Fe-S-cluster containining protein
MKSALRMIEQMWQRASESERAMLVAMCEHYERELARALRDAINEHSAIASIHAAIDEETQRTRESHPRGRDVPCAKGCSHCCHLPVDATRLEAELALSYADELDVPINMTRLAKQATKTHETWSDLTLGERRCVFLGAGGVCRVYEHRPAACRKYMVVGNPRDCDTGRKYGGRVMFLAAPEAEAATNAIYLHERADHLPRLLLRLVHERRHE